MADTMNQGQNRQESENYGESTRDSVGFQDDSENYSEATR